MILAPQPQPNPKNLRPQKPICFNKKEVPKVKKKSILRLCCPKVSCMQRDGGKVTSAIKLLISTAWLKEFPINIMTYQQNPLNQGVGTYNSLSVIISHKCHTCHMPPLIHRMKGWAPSSWCLSCFWSHTLCFFLNVRKVGERLFKGNTL